VQQRNMLKENLSKAVEEIRAGGDAPELPDPAEVAKRIEAAMYKHFGERCSRLPVLAASLCSQFSSRAFALFLSAW
jgi:hypothetical protein